MRCFDHVAKLIRTKRVNHPKGLSQSDLSHLLGYKNGQFISNVERGLCSIPLKMLAKVSQILDIDTDDLKQAILKDQSQTIDNHLEKGMAEETKVSQKPSENMGTVSPAWSKEGL